MSMQIVKEFYSDATTFFSLSFFSAWIQKRHAISAIVSKNVQI